MGLFSWSAFRVFHYLLTRDRTCYQVSYVRVEGMNLLGKWASLTRRSVQVAPLTTNRLSIPDRLAESLSC
jgi:ribosomal protein L7Ae-like RNA K-turn-binding protein